MQALSFRDHPTLAQVPLPQISQLNEFLKARRQIDSQQKQIEALTAGLQKVSAQIEIMTLTPRTVSNNH